MQPDDRRVHGGDVFSLSGGGVSRVTQPVGSAAGQRARQMKGGDVPERGKCVACTTLANCVGGAGRAAVHGARQFALVGGVCMPCSVEGSVACPSSAANARRVNRTPPVVREVRRDQIVVQHGEQRVCESWPKGLC